MSLPPLAPIPPATIRLSIAPEEWEACLESWLTLAGLQLSRLAQQSSGKLVVDPSLPQFLVSFYHETAQIQPGDKTLQTPTAVKLRRATLALASRLLTTTKIDPGLLQMSFVADFCRVHAKAQAVDPLLKELWRRKVGQFSHVVEAWKKSLLKTLNVAPTEASLRDLRQLVDVLRVSPDAAMLFMTGSDFLDALASAYTSSASDEHRGILVAVAYFGLVSLVNVEPPNISLLSDQLYSLKAQAEKSKTSILADLVTNTPLVSRLRRSLGAGSNTRLNTLLDAINIYKTPSIARAPKHPRGTKGKGKAPQGNGEIHMHRMSLVTQVQDLFPDLGSGFVLKLLDEYDDDVEQVTAHLLDDSLPSHLRNLDRTEHTTAFETSPQAELNALVPHSTPPQQPYIPDRRNVFDVDEFDRLEFESSRLHIGKKETSPSQPNQTKPPSSPPSPPSTPTTTSATTPTTSKTSAAQSTPRIQTANPVPPPK